MLSKEEREKYYIQQIVRFACARLRDAGVTISPAMQRAVDVLDRSAGLYGSSSPGCISLSEVGTPGRLTDLLTANRRLSLARGWTSARDQDVKGTGGL